MKGNRIVIWIVVAELLLCGLSNFLLLRKDEDAESLQYRVDTQRAGHMLEEGSMPKAEDYSTIISIAPFDPAEKLNCDYTVARAKDGTLYRITYESGKKNGRAFLILNLSWGLILLLTIGGAVYIFRKILIPFHRMEELPLELAKGNLTIPVKEEKDRYFGKYLWSMDMLREKLESEKNQRLQMEQEKKTLVLSISHDIKTPLSAIKLYNRALSGGIYETEEKKQEAYQGIDKNLNELEKYIDEIQMSAREDFLQLKVKDEDWYLSEVMERLEQLYREKTASLHAEFSIDPMKDCIIRGDKERGLEVLQNLMENALKYGDGKRIHISFSDEEDCRLVTVENTGCTLPERELPNIFDSFYRGSNAEKAKGSGLGLYICRQLMRAMDGDIFAEVEGERFRVTAVFRKR